MKKLFAASLAFTFVLISTISLYAQQTDTIKRMISFTTQNTVKLEVTFEKMPPANEKFNIKIADYSSGKVIFSQQLNASTVLKAENKMIFRINKLNVDSWFPTDPKLYNLTFTATNSGDKIQQLTQRIGFRFFEAKNGHLYLNGQPIFLRGIAINPPGRGIPDSIETSRKFAEDYIRFMKSIHVNIIRIPDDTTWYNVCDELGMMVFGGNYSGSVDGEKPPKDYAKAIRWYEDEKFAPIAHHPSLMIYAMTNETPFRGSSMPKWKKFLSYAHTELKKWDDTRVYIGDAGYGYGQSGDICDLHRYWGWYYSSPFTFLHIRNNADIIPVNKPKNQPVTFTECVGNYTGPGGQYNLTPDHKNPGSQLNWTGHAPWDLQAQLADEHQCFTFRHATEYFRQLRNINPDLSGLFPFTILFHNWNTIRNFVDMDPKAVTQQAKISYQPLLISWECFTPQAYAGATIHPVAHIINDDDYFSDLDNAVLIYQLCDKTNAALLSDTIKLPLIKYYGTYQKAINIKLPKIIAAGDYQLRGKIMKGDSLVSKNNYELFIAGDNYIHSAPLPQKEIWLYDPKGNTQKALNKLAVNRQMISSFDHLNNGNHILIIGENDADEKLKTSASLIQKFVKNGGRIICLRQDAAHLNNLNAILNYPLENIDMDLDTPVYPPPPRPSRNGYNINPELPDNLIFAGITRKQLRYWSDYTNWNESKTGFPAIYPVTDGFVLKDNNAIAATKILADYGPALDGIALAEMFNGKGSILLSGMDLVSRAGLDPVADRLLKNMIAYSATEKPHHIHPLIKAPIIWGDYASEKGLITGVTSGLLLNEKPKLEGAYSKIPLVIAKEGYEFAGHPGGFNSRPGLQYLPFGRRPFGPYHLRGFGNIPEPDQDNNNIGEGSFWCRVPAGKTTASTVVWNPSKKDLALTIDVNQQTVTKEIKAGEKIAVDCPINSTAIKMTFKGDRRLVLLQTSFN